MLFLNYCVIYATFFTVFIFINCHNDNNLYTTTLKYRQQRFCLSTNLLFTAVFGVSRILNKPTNIMKDNNIYKIYIDRDENPGVVLVVCE